MRPFEALLLDLDGTLVNSRVATEGAWRDWAQRAGLAAVADEVARSCHGVPSVQHVAHWAPQLDAAAESAAIEAAQTRSDEPTPQFRGAFELLRLLPRDRLAIVTSGTPELARRRMRGAGIAPPAVTVFAGDVPEGKPHPAPYLLAAERLGVAPADCVVVEDAPAGIAAGRAAGAQVLAVAHTHAAAELAGADVVVADLGEALAPLRAARVLPDRDAALAQVAAAFADVPRPADADLLRPDAYDDVDVRVLYGIPGWRAVPEDVVVGGWAALGGLSDPGFAAFVAAWLTWTLEHPDDPSYAAEAVDGELRRRGASALDEGQREAADAWLLALADWL